MRPAESLATTHVALPYSVEVWTSATATWVTVTVTDAQNLGTSESDVAPNNPASVTTTSDTGLQREQVGGIVVGVGGLILLVALLWCCCVHRRRGRYPQWSPPPSPRPPPRSPPRPPRPPQPPPPPMPPHPPTQPIPWPPRPRPPSGTQGPPNFTFAPTPGPKTGPEAGPQMHTGVHGSSRPPLDHALHLTPAQLKPRTTLIPPIADNAYDKAESKAITTKEGQTFLVGTSNGMDKPIGFVRKPFKRRAQPVVLPPEKITILGGYRPDGGTTVPATEEPHFTFETAVRQPRSPAVARATNHDNMHELETAAAFAKARA